MAGLQRRSTSAFNVAALAAAMLLSATAGRAGDTEPAPDSAHPQIDQMIERELGRLVDRLQGALEKLPRYALPEITEEGDIIIRRLPRNPRERPNPGDPDDILEL